jgi:hypothetical protein
VNEGYLNQMYVRFILLFFLTLTLSGCGVSQKPAKHLFILSGQSNMVGLDPNTTFTPTIAAAFGEDNIVVVKDALDGQPIRHWYRGWQPAQGNSPKASAYLYNRLFKKLKPIINQNNLTSITFIWMQGEADAQQKHGSVYQASLIGLFDQLAEDMARDDIHFIIGRISDFDLNNQHFKDWTLVRDAQTKVAQQYPRSTWVNTDDLNDGVNAKGEAIVNDLHYSVEGYKKLGKRFALSAIDLINQNSAPQAPTPNQ